jgi:RHS repeat-associated protein
MLNPTGRRETWRLAVRAALFFSVALLVVVDAKAQSSTDGTTPSALTPGAPAGAYPLSGFESVNLFNGNLNFSLPMLQVSGRGGARAALVLKLEQHWRIEHGYCAGCTGPYYATDNWWTFLNPGYGPGVMQYRTAFEGDEVNGNGEHFPDNSLMRVTFTASDGTEYEMRDVATSGEPKPVDWQDLVPPPGGRTYLRGTVFATADGTSATFISCQRNGGLIPVYDGDDSGGSGIRPAGYLLFRDGTRYRIDTGLVSWIRDRNGNITSFLYENVDISGQQYGRVIQITDSMNRQVNIQYNVTDPTYGTCDKLTFNGYNSTPKTVAVSKTNLGSCLRSGFHLRTLANLFPELYGSPTNYDPTKVSALWLPNGKSYKFYYNDYGELARVELPTGGAIEYDWAPGVNNLPYTNGIPPSGIVNDNVYRRVVVRRVYPTGGSGTAFENRTTYSTPETLNGQSLDNVGYVLAYQYASDGSVLSRTKHYFDGYASYNPYIFSLAPFGRIYYVPWKWAKEGKTETLDLITDTTVLRRVEQNFEQRLHVPWWVGTAIEEPPNDPRVTYTLTTLTDVSPNLVSKQTAINPQDSSIVGFDQYNNPTDVWEYDYGSGAPGNLMRHTVTQYLTSGYDTVSGSPGAPDPVGAIHIRNLPSTQQIFDAGGTLRAQISYEYDHYNQNGNETNHATLTDRANISGIASRKNTTVAGGYVPTTDYSRGNVTKVSRWLNTGGSVDAYQQYDIAGSVVQSIDPMGNATLFAYSSSFQYAFPTQTTSSIPDSSGVTGSSSALVTSTNYDFSTGLVISSTDANGQTTYADYTDPLDRLTSVVRPTGGGSTTYSYADTVGNLYLRTQTVQDASVTLTVDQMFDGMGRAVEMRAYEPGGGYISTQQQYDGMGRVKQVSNPFRPASESVVWTTTGYDGLGRGVSVTTPDLAVVSTSYSGNMVLVTDQALKKRISQTNGLGQLTQVWEVTPSDSSTVSVTFNGLNYTAYQTSYLYDALDDLAKVTQGSQSRYFMYDSLKRLIRGRNPEQDTSSSLTLTDPVTGNSAWCVSYEYYNSGNLYRKTDSRSPAVVTTNTYDKINRIVSRGYSDSTPAVSYKYDGAGASGGVLYSRGRLTLVSSSVSTYSYDEYDQMGRVKRCTQTTASQPYSMSYAYDLAGHMTSETYPSGRQVITEYDSAGRAAGIRAAAIFYAGARASDATNRIQYTAHGAVSAMKFDNDLWEHTNFNSRLQPTQIGLGTSGTDSSILKLDYEYTSSCQTGNNGNVLKQTINASGLILTQTYCYDALNRLSSASENSGASWSQTYGFDRYGNRWVNGYIVPGNESRTPTSQSAFNQSNNQIQLSGFGYDTSGNLKNDPTTVVNAMLYDAENRQVSYTKNGTTTYSYDGDGHRVKKVTGSVTTVFVYNAAGQLTAEYTNDTTPPVGGGGTSYLTSDHLGSTRVVMKDDGTTVKARYDYLPFGEEIPATIGSRGGVTGYGGADSTKQKFTQKERDNESGLDYFLARYYSSAQGRFTSADNFLNDTRTNDPASWNLYVYVRNNPLRYVDPSGEEVFSSNLSDEEKRKLIGDLKNKTGYQSIYFDKSNKLVVDTSAGSKGAQLRRERSCSTL